jgi:undecaprenyl-diphosphatase
MRPVWLLAAVAVAVAAYLRRRSTGPLARALSALVAVALALVGLGLVETPDVEELIVDLGTSLGPYTYVLVGALAFLETGAFVGLVAPGETAVLVGGVVAGQGQVDPLALIALVWCCAVAGDVTSYALGRKLGRDFLLRHGPKLKITEKRLLQVEGFFERHGGVTLLVGRFIGVVRALLPFVAGASRVPLAKFLPYDVLGAGVWSATFVRAGLPVLALHRHRHHLPRAGALPARRDRGARRRGGVRAAPRGAPAGARPGTGLARAPGRAARRRDRSCVALEPAWRACRAPARPSRGPSRPLRVRAPHSRRPGLELTTLVAIVAVGGFTVVALAESIDDQRRLLPGDGRAVLDRPGALCRTAERVIEVLTHHRLPSRHRGGDRGDGRVGGRARPPDRRARARRRAGADLRARARLKALEDRPRPVAGARGTMYQSYPSGHAAYAVALVACAVVLVRTRPGLGTRSTAITAAVVLMIFVGLSRIYLRAHYSRTWPGGSGSARPSSRAAASPPSSSSSSATMGRREQHPAHVPDRRRGRRALPGRLDRLIVVPAWTAYSRLWERLVALVMSVYVLAAFVLAGAGSRRAAPVLLRRDLSSGAS